MDDRISKQYSCLPIVYPLAYKTKEDTERKTHDYNFNINSYENEPENHPILRKLRIMIVMCIGPYHGHHIIFVAHWQPTAQQLWLVEYKYTLYIFCFSWIEFFHSSDRGQAAVKS